MGFENLTGSLLQRQNATVPLVVTPLDEPLLTGQAERQERAEDPQPEARLGSQAGLLEAEIVLRTLEECFDHESAAVPR